ncbi:MAG: response regulator, partial [Sulfitobacter sp.]|nr:response regulator [Sulfitobacter sp.]
VLLVDDHAMLRKGMAALLGAEPDITVVGEAGDGEQAIARARALQPDVVVMDISLPGLGGIGATRRILAESPESQVIALSMHAAKRFVDDMLDAGAAGYLLKESAPEELVQGIRAVMRGEMVLSGTIGATVVSSYVEGMEKDRRPGGADAGVSILQTKLNPPRLRADILARPLLIERLERNLQRPLTLISAPAGYGKSTIACRVPQ